ncbi:hypothetical protein PHMEG_00021217 [Phytophthora megakarya]|uniref:Reverse transcriptase n=1 Tax=Phytophthora megakarya TaxID=4795 RepID=A0A225VNC4_9STRA|nr:hypothetical protein PHMEG_00021217 [Phytophthora megakarya]
MLIKEIRKGQDQSRYLVLDIGLRRLLKNVSYSPFELFTTSLIPNNVREAAVLARRILKVEGQEPGAMKMLTGDVHGAFRNIPLAAVAVGRFQGQYQNWVCLLSICSCPFGWTVSPGHYWSAGAAINHIHSNSRPTWPDQPQTGAMLFDDKAWCDDHICIEPNIGSRAVMTGVLGPDACNEQNVSQWFREGTAFGLTWNLNTMSLSIPPDKISKAIRRLQNIPLFQRITALARSASRFRAVTVTDDVRDDIRWFLSILAVDRLNLVPLALLYEQQDPEFYITMDASDRVSFNATGEGDFGINLRELMDTIFATVVWRPIWEGSRTSTSRHVRFLIEKTVITIRIYAQRKRENCSLQRDWRSSVEANMGGFTYIYLSTCPALLEVRYNFYGSAGHIAGETNIMADVGSRSRHPREISTSFESASPHRRSGRHISCTLQEGLESVGNMPWLNEHELNDNAAQLGAFARGEGNTYSTICGKLCAIRWYHRNTADYDPGVKASHAILLRGIRRFTSSFTKQYPVLPALLLRIYNSINLRHARVQLFWGGILLGIYMSATSFMIKLRDIRFLDAE